MTEEDARRALLDHLAVPRETVDRLAAYVTRLIGANDGQNLISAASAGTIWQRHILDSAQLSPLMRGRVIDVGSGSGLPGLVLAIIGHPVTLVEPRRLRAAFLRSVVDALELASPVFESTVERLRLPPFETITARAYAPLDRILASTIHASHARTRWVLPKGRGWMSELEVARSTWHGSFSTVPSITDPDAMIVIAEGVSPKAKR